MKTINPYILITVLKYIIRKALASEIRRKINNDK
jgi:hypothetical protein